TLRSGLPLLFSFPVINHAPALRHPLLAGHAMRVFDLEIRGQYPFQSGVAIANHDIAVLTVLGRGGKEQHEFSVSTFGTGIEIGMNRVSPSFRGDSFDAHGVAPRREGIGSLIRGHP